MNTAIIVAAGSGNRFGSKTPKQFLKIKNKPILIYAIERFENCNSIDEIALVLSEDEIFDFSKTLKNYNFSKLEKIVTGGKTRAESVLNGLDSVSSEDKHTDIVAIHDGARPLVSTDEISNTIKKAQECGAACLVAEVTDTIKEVSNDRIVKTIDRSKLRRALTPQAFRYEIICEAFEKNEISEIATDECFLVEQLGYEIAIIEGSSKNIKITHEQDLRIAEVFLSQ